MRKHSWVFVVMTCGLTLLSVLSSPSRVQAQGLGTAVSDGPSEPAPRFPDGTVNLGPPPGGKGFWGSGGSIFGQGRNTLETNLTLEEVPLHPWAKAIHEYRDETNGKDDPHARCFPPGGPRQFQTPNGFEFIQQPELDRIIIVFGGGPRSWRVVYTDGRPLPPATEDRIPTYFGYATGRWEGDTLVVESTGYNEKFWFHRGGLPHTDRLHLTERISRPNFNTLQIEVTVDDPGAYTRTWTGGFVVPWTFNNWDGTEGGEIHEYLCQDNNRDPEHLVGR